MQRLEDIKRCAWVPLADPIYVDYHDREWGVPVYDDIRLFRMLILEGAQAGLSWSTVLKKIPNYDIAMDCFDPYKIAHYDDNRLQLLLSNPGIIRNRRKLESAVNNARAYIKLVEETGSFCEALWQFVGGQPKINHWESHAQVPVSTPESDALSKFLISKGFNFAGTTICYALMQSVGMVNDHTKDCFRHRQISLLP